jgi:hypothetical protein
LASLIPLRLPHFLRCHHTARWRIKRISRTDPHLIIEHFNGIRRGIAWRLADGDPLVHPFVENWMPIDALAMLNAFLVYLKGNTLQKQQIQLPRVNGLREIFLQPKLEGDRIRFRVLGMIVLYEKLKQLGVKLFHR